MLSLVRRSSKSFFGQPSRFAGLELMRICLSRLFGDGDAIFVPLT
jgi:hypothetical protein